MIPMEKKEWLGTELYRIQDFWNLISYITSMMYRILLLELKDQILSDYIWI